VGRWLYIQGPTCTKNGGGKKLKKIVDEMAAPFGVLHTCTAERETGTERARESERDRQTERERQRDRDRDFLPPLPPSVFILLPGLGSSNETGVKETERERVFETCVKRGNRL
jgi:hypothetical protein